MKSGTIASFLIPVFLLTGWLLRGQTTVTLATSFAPGSSVSVLLNRAASDISKRSEGRLTLKIFYNGVQGSERTLVNKMKQGQLDGALLTAEGLKFINSGLQVLELPLLITTSAEAASVHFSMAEQLGKLFADGGFRLACWADPGSAFIFSRDPVNDKAALEGMRMGVFSSDATGMSFLKKCQVSMVPMGEEEISPSLQTGSIIACYGTPSDAVNQQWITKLYHVMADPFRYRSGAVVFRKELDQKLSPELNRIIEEAFDAIEADLENIAITTNASASKAIDKAGVESTRMSAAALADLQKTAVAVWEEKCGTLYPAEVLEKVRGIVKK